MARPRLVSDDDIRAAVRKGVLEQGPQVSLDLIAERLGVTAPALFKRFGSKNALLIESLKLPDNPPFFDVLRQDPDPKRPFEPQLRAIIDSHMKFLDESFPCMSALRESGIPKEELSKMFKKGPLPSAVKLFSGWLERACLMGLIDAPNPGALSVAILGVGQMPVMIRHMQKMVGGFMPDLDGYSGLVARILSRGLASLSPSTRPTSTPKKRLS